MIVKYLYDFKDGDKKPFGTVVALSPDQIGVSLCSRGDRFTKSRGREIATARAIRNLLPQMVQGFVQLSDGRTSLKNVVILSTIRKVREKATNLQNRPRQGEEIQFLYPEHGTGKTLKRFGVFAGSDKDHIYVETLAGPRTFMKLKIEELTNV